MEKHIKPADLAENPFSLIGNDWMLLQQEIPKKATP